MVCGSMVIMAALTKKLPSERRLPGDNFGGEQTDLVAGAMSDIRP